MVRLNVVLFIVPLKSTPMRRITQNIPLELLLSQRSYSFVVFNLQAAYSNLVNKPTELARVIHLKTI